MYYHMCSRRKPSHGEYETPVRKYGHPPPCAMRIELEQ